VKIGVTGLLEELAHPLGNLTAVEGQKTSIARGDARSISQEPMGQVADHSDIEEDFANNAILCDGNITSRWSTESVTHAVHRFYQVYNQVCNDHNTSLWEQVMAPSYVGHVNGQTIPNREVGKGLVAALLSAFPDIHYSIKDALQVGDRAVVRRSATATHTETSSVWRPRRRRLA
jgi:SnoaL-like polyketide cyclase